MSLEKENPVIETGANPENGANEPKPQTEGIKVDTQPQVDTEKTDEGKTYSQKDLDNVAAKARGTAERETQKKILAQLGLNAYDEGMLTKYKEAYENSLTQEEKRTKELNDISQENAKLKAEVEEKNYIIQALIAMSGKKEEDVDKIVKMARGLRTEENTIADCITEVLNIIGKPAENGNVPVGQPLTQPSATLTINADANPFKDSTLNLTEQGRLIRENPELAKRLAREAGKKLNI